MRNCISYSEAELDILREFYPENGSDLCAEIIRLRFGMERSPGGVAQKARLAGIAFRGQLRGGFYKGQPAHNKGRPMRPETLEKLRPTMFQKGNIPKSTILPPGHSGISIRCDKCGRPYKFIRVAIGEWMPLARHTWLNFMGAIPPGHVVRHIDGDTLNCDIKNLELITKRDNVLRNSNRAKFRETWNDPTDKMVHGRLKHRGFKSSLEDCRAEGLIDITRAQIALNRSLSQKVKNDQ